MSLLSLGSYSVTVTEDGRGLQYTLKSSTVSLVAFAFMILFAQKTFVIMLLLMALSTNPQVSAEISRVFGHLPRMIESGVHETLKSIENLTKHVSEMRDVATDTPHAQYHEEKHEEEQEEKYIEVDDELLKPSRFKVETLQEPYIAMPTISEEEHLELHA